MGFCLLAMPMFLIDILIACLVSGSQRPRETQKRDASAYVGGGSLDIRSIVLELPPAPAALVDVGLAFAALSARSAAAFRLMAVFGPPGGDVFRPVLTAPAVEGVPGDDGCGED